MRCVQRQNLAALLVFDSICILCRGQKPLQYIQCQHFHNFRCNMNFTLVSRNTKVIRYSLTRITYPNFELLNLCPTTNGFSCFPSSTYLCLLSASFTDINLDRNKIIYPAFYTRNPDITSLDALQNNPHSIRHLPQQKSPTHTPCTRIPQTLPDSVLSLFTRSRRKSFTREGVGSCGEREREYGHEQAAAEIGKEGDEGVYGSWVKKREFYGSLEVDMKEASVLSLLC